MDADHPSLLWLAIDTALNGTLIALGFEGDVIAHCHDQRDRGQAEYLVPLIKDLLLSKEISFKDIGCIAVTRGPGAFTGLRVGLSTARSLAVSLSIPVYGVSTFDVLAHGYFKKAAYGRSLAVILESKRQDLYAAFYDAQGGCQAMGAYSPAELSKRLEPESVLIGNGLKSYLDKAGDRQGQAVHSHHQCNPDSLIALAAKKKRINAAWDIDPLYLRDADVSLSSKIFHKII